MKVLVTGARGFIGRHAVRALRDYGHDVTELDTFHSWTHGGRDLLSARSIGDATVNRMCGQALPVMEANEIETVVHLAAIVSVGESATHMAEFAWFNCWDTAVMLDAMRLRHERQPFAKLVVASSMSVYGDVPGGIADENMPCNPTSYYGATKLHQEQACLIAGQQMRIETTALRFFNVYGPGQSESNQRTGVIANFAATIRRGERPRIFGDGRQLRDFVFVGDVVKAVIAAVEKPGCGPVNIGTGVGTSIVHAASMIAESLGEVADFEITGRDRFGDCRHCIADTRKAAEALGWRSQTSLRDGLRETFICLPQQIPTYPPGTPQSVKKCLTL